MKWYAAHIIMYVQFKEERQSKYPIWENVVLVNAETVDEARKKAMTFGHQEEGDSQGTFTWDDKPATWIFGGIRKLIECEPSLEQNIEDAEQGLLGDGSEITYSQFKLNSEESLKNFIKGEPVMIFYEK